MTINSKIIFTSTKYSDWSKIPFEQAFKMMKIQQKHKKYIKNNLNFLYNIANIVKEVKNKKLI